MGKILVTGAAGFVGYHLTSHLRSLGYEVFLLDIHDRLDRIEYGNRNLAERNQQQLQLHQADLTEGVRDLPDDLEAIIHLAALPHVDYSYYYPEQVFHNNVHSTARLMDYARERDIPFILGSSVEIYGGEQSDPYAETDPYNPVSPYAASKVACETLLKTYVRCFGMKGMIFRLTNLYGPWQAPDRIIPRNICRICDRVELDIQSNVIRDFLFVEDAVRAITLIMEQGITGEIYNISSGIGTSMSEVGRILAELAGEEQSAKPPKQYDQEFTNARGASLIINSAKLQQLGWRPQISLEEGLARTLRWYEEHHTWGSKFRDQYIADRSDGRFIVDIARSLRSPDEAVWENEQLTNIG